MAKKVNKRKKQNTSLISNIIFSIITLFALSVCIFTLLTNNYLNGQIEMSKKENEQLKVYNSTHIYTEEDIKLVEEKVRQEEATAEKEALLDDIKQIMDGGYSSYYLLRYLYPDDIVVTSDDGFDFYPINKELKQNRYAINNFLQDEETEEITYVDDNKEVLSLKGIDVSSFNGKIEWDKVKDSGVDFVYIRAALRGSSEGKLMLDSNFENNLNGAIDNDIPAGVYFFTQALNESEAVEEARFLLEAISDFDVDYPIALDVEKLEGRTDKLTKEQRTLNVIAFLEEIKKTGREVLIYGNLHSLIVMLDMEKLEDYDKWFAYYSYPVYLPYDFSIWQYSSKGKVDGIKGDVDMNICMKKYI